MLKTAHSHNSCGSANRTHQSVTDAQPDRSRLIRFLEQMVIVVCSTTIGLTVGIGQAEEFQAQVTNVSDGDTITIRLANGKEEHVRFLICDAPESNQPYGDKSAAFTRKKSLNQTVTIRTDSRDTYGRILGEVILRDGTNLNRELIRQGLAHWFYHYNDDPKAGMLEIEAKVAKRGLWADDSPIYPRAWRRGARLTPVDPPPLVDATGVVIFSATPNPRGLDAGNETFTIANFTKTEVDLRGWLLTDDDGGRFPLSGTLKVGGRLQFKLDAALQLGNSGDTLQLHDAAGRVVHRVIYSATEVQNGLAIQFVKPTKKTP